MSGQTALVTGAAVAGYGQAITEDFLSRGYRVIGTYFGEDRETALAWGRGKEGLELYEVELDQRESLVKFVEAVRGNVINAMVFAQFFWNMEDPDHFDHDAWDKSIAVNLTSVNYLCHELKPIMPTRSSIVIITSTEGLIGSFGGTAYAAARAAEHNLAKSLANNFGPIGIRVNALAAGWIGDVMDTDEIFNESRRFTPLGRLGLGSEIAATVRFLTSEDAGFINGATIVADGGYSGVDYMAKYEYEQSRNEA